MKFTIPIQYSNQDFDEIQQRASALTQADREAGRPAPAGGYSARNFEIAREEHRRASEEYYGRK